MTQETKEELIKDIKFLQKRIVEFETVDIKRKKAEETLKAERQRLHDMLETMPIMICLLTPDYHVAFANHAFREKFGESHGRHCYDYCFGKKEPCNFCETYSVLKTAKPHHWQVTTPDGTSVIDVYDFPFTDVDGSPMILEVDVDITERKKIENMLQKQQEEQQVILDSVPAGIFYKDKKNRFIRVNKILAEVMGMPKKQLEGKSLFDFFPKERAEAYWKDDKEVMVSGNPKRNIIEPLETKKRSFWVQTDKIPYRDAQGNIIGIIGFTIDITERKQAETELKESHEQLRILARHLQKDRETERARIAKELHDELGQTLTAIKIDYAYLQKKLGLLQKPLGEEVKGLSGLINTTINMVRKLTMDLRPAMLDDIGLIPAVEWMIKGVQKRTSIKLELTAKPSHLKLDPDLSLTIFRIIQEALTNIIRYAQATRVQIILKKGPGCFNLMVKDNGIGIRQEQIKNPYSLGLVGMKERVMSYGGKLEITGEKGKGTTIKVFIPLEKGKNENTDS